MNKIAAVLAFLCITLGLPPTAEAGSFTVTTDFSASFTGRRFEKSSSTPVSSNSAPIPSYGAARTDADYQAFLAQRHKEQAAEAQRQAEAQRLRREAEQAKLRNDVQAIGSLLQQLERLEADEPSPLKRAEYTEQVLELLKRFDAARAAYLEKVPDYNRRLGAALASIHVPPPYRRHYNRVLIWGAMSTPAEARAATSRGLADPFTGEAFDNVFAFGTSGAADILTRAAPDHFLREFGRLSKTTTAQLGGLEGVTADEVVCHSNGCRIAEVLIQQGLMRTKVLRILGGDNVMWDLSTLQRLGREKRIEIEIYAIKGDPIPVIDVGWKIMDKMERIGRALETYAGVGADPTYQVLGVTDPPAFDPGAKFQVHVVSYPYVSNPLSKHAYENYARVIKGWRMSHCLEPSGWMNRRCLIY